MKIFVVALGGRLVMATFKMAPLKKSHAKVVLSPMTDNFWEMFEENEVFL